VDIKVEGIQDLVGKIKKLDDKMTRREVLKIQRKLAKPLVKAYREELPEQSGNLKRSVAAETVPGRKVDGNPQIVVRPSTKGKKNGYYRHMVVAKGTQLGSNKRGSRKGVNTVVDQARDSVVSKRNSLTTAKYEKQMTRFVQKQIDKLSK
jgi:hypothetical protein